jgi:hypothetical protein
MFGTWRLRGLLSEGEPAGGDPPAQEPPATDPPVQDPPAGVTVEALAAIEGGEEAAKSTTVDFGDLDAAAEAYGASQDEGEPSGQERLGTQNSELGAQEAAAEALAAEYRKLPGVVADLIGGNTVEEVTASLARSRNVFETVKSQALQEAGEAVPPARGGPSNQGVPAPATPFGLIAAGLDAHDRRVKA